MKKILFIIICFLVVVVLVTGCLNNDKTQSDNNESITYTITIKLGNTSSSYFLQTYYKVYENVQNWKDTDPLIGTTSIIFEEGFPDASSFNVTVGKTYILEIWNICECSNCASCYIPENMLDKHFVGTFSSDETFIIQTTGYVTKSDGSLLNQSLSP